MPMHRSLPALREDEVRHCQTENDDEAGFGALKTERGCLPLKALDVQARIDGLIARVQMTQTFVNAHAEALEATYIFPLPDRAAVTRFRLEVAGRVVEGELKERAAARQEYDQAIQAGHRAGIAEEERPGVFTLRVGNLPPGETATVKLTLCGPLLYDSGEATFRFPANPSAMAFRRIRTQCRTPRASRRRCCCPATPTPSGSASLSRSRARP